MTDTSVTAPFREAGAAEHAANHRRVIRRTGPAALLGRVSAGVVSGTVES